MIAGKSQRVSSQFLWFRTTTEPFNELGSSAASNALRNEVLFPTRQNLGEPTVDDFVKNAIDFVTASPKMEETLLGTTFAAEAPTVLKSILMGDWAVVGFLSNSNSGTKADLSKFLKSGESIERTKDILSAACRLVLLLGYIFGPTAYRPWYLELHLTLTEEVPLSTIHPGAFKEFLTSHIKLFLSTHPSN